jgi:SAM-dependent methyltransferase
MNWDNVYNYNCGGQWEPTDGMIKLISRYVQRRIGAEQYQVKKKVDLALDIGCGNGNHISFLEKQGIHCIGIDLSEFAISNAHARLKKEGHHLHEITIMDAECLNYPIESFDLILSDGVLDHIVFQKSQIIVEKVFHLLKPGGYFFLSLRSTNDSEFGRGQFVEKNTYKLEGGYENGEIQHFFDITEIHLFLEKFKIFDLERYEVLFPDKYTLDKAFHQSSKGTKIYLDDIESAFKKTLKSSRWYIAAEKI